MITYNKILYELATKNALPKCAIYALSGNQQSVLRKLDEAIKQGHVREVKSECKRKGKRPLKVSIITITRQGLDYLYDHCYRDIPWLEDAQGLENVNKIINNQKMSREDIAKRYYRISTVGAMADMAGAEELIIHLYQNELNNTTRQTTDSEETQEASTENNSLLSENDKLDPTSMSSCLQNALVAYEHQSKRLPYYDEIKACYSGIRFYDALAAKRAIEQLFKDTKRTADVRGGTMSGMFIFKKKAYLAYSSLRYSLYTPDAWNWKRDRLCYIVLCNELLHMGVSVDNINGILFVDGVKSFVATYDTESYSRNVGTLTRKVKNIHRTGDFFQEMFVVPITNLGTKELNVILTTDLMGEKKKIVKILTDSRDFYENSDVSPSLFPLTDDFDVLYHVGVHIDINSIRKIANLQDHYGDSRSFGILCRKWQVPYYEAVLDGVEIRDIDDYLEGTDIKNPERTELKMTIEAISEVEKKHHPQRW